MPKPYDGEAKRRRYWTEIALAIPVVAHSHPNRLDLLEWTRDTVHGWVGLGVGLGLNLNVNDTGGSNHPLSLPLF